MKAIICGVLATLVAASSVVAMADAAPQPLHDQHRQLIIGGHKAPVGRFPYFSTLQHYCGGSLIAPDVILTAGHCLPPHKHSVQPHVAKYSYLEGGVHTQEVYDIRHMVRHPGWKALGEDEFRHDMSLLFLSESSDQPYVHINRDPQMPTAGQPLIVMGVGWTSNDWERAKKSEVLRETELNYLPTEQCRLSNNTSSSSSSSDDDDTDDGGDEEFVTYEGRVHSDHLCTTGGPNNERDACAFDSGSPVIIPGDTAQDDILVGLVSWGEGCSDPDFPGVNTRVSDGLDFIQENVCKYSANPPPEFRCGGGNTMEPTMSPTMTPPTTTNNHKHFSFGQIGSAAIAMFILFWMIRQWTSKKHGGDDTMAWISPLPPEKRPIMLEKRFSSSSETAYMSQFGSPSTLGSRQDGYGSAESYLSEEDDGVQSLIV